MASRLKALAVLCICAALSPDYVHSSQDIMKSISTGFAKALQACQKELELPENVMQEFYNFWKEDFQLVNRDMGCAIMCMASKFDLVTEDQKLHHVNAHEFARKHGADDEMAKQLVTIIHNCVDVSSSQTDDCLKVLEIAKCFKTKIHELKWAPTMEIVLEEVMTEI